MKSQTVLLLLAASSALAQGTFQNLGFEQAVVPVVGSGQAVGVPLTNMLPEWTGYVFTNQAFAGYYNTIAHGAPNIGLIDGHTSVYSNAVIEGYFTALLQAGLFDLQYVSAGIGQTALIPFSARSLLFDASVLDGSISNFLVTVGGQAMPLTQVGAGANFKAYGVDISSFAGQTAELRFTAQFGGGLPGHSTGVFLDNIQFSASVIPEPSVLALSALGTVLLTWRFLRQTRPRLTT